MHSLSPPNPLLTFPCVYPEHSKDPGKLTQADCFRVGSIGRMFEKDMLHLVSSVKTALMEQGVRVPVTQIQAP